MVVRRQRNGVAGGLSLPEVLISTAILAIVLAIALPFLVTVDRAWSSGSAEQQAAETARATGLVMTHWGRQARRLLNVSEPANTTGRLLFEATGADGHPYLIDLYYQPTTSAGTAGDVRVSYQDLTTGAQDDYKVAGPVTELRFCAFERDGVTAATDPWQVGLVEGRIQSTSPDGSAAATAVATIDLPAERPLFAIFSAGANTTKIEDGSRVRGDVYCGGDLVVEAGSSVQQPYLAHVAGSTFGSDVTVAPAPQPLSSLPPLDTSYYDDLLAQAAAQPLQDRYISKQEQFVGFENLPNRTFLVNGDCTINGPVAVMGPGTIVATDDIWLTGPTNLHGKVNLIAGDMIFLDGNINIPGQPFFYARTRIQVDKDKNVQAHLICGNYLRITDKSKIRGLVYARRAHLEADVTGAVYANHVCHVRKLDLKLDDDIARDEVPGLQLW